MVFQFYCHAANTRC